ncbi:hypothetical protein ASE17_03240 [Phenylobacterium sp. Root77]|jgi:hypothetical protein|uniref:hypothetical protein n=1 Tax=unclassified Phenylobacterium TaxID=2640670 RepID=UPI0006FC380E|nr:MULTISPECIES: hypothetical protein [unclassified Phenylobacterium]KQW71908.1 hypothetical protein ASC73_07465 [Phenylobacterium sp. Root1277]KQW94829.1 hypothetical protein ASC79_03610 [Phenylobacterium sp. Root1290]KRC44523.1 hypothetical protein ASE17_03240 [Phenylobacterium sp. Root77]
MARNNQSPEFEIEVGGEPYLWRLHRQPQWSSDTAKWRGMALAVRHKEGQREAVVEFPPGPQRRFGAPQLQPSHIARELVARAITSAVSAGWEPLSRGKTVAIEVDETGG